MVAEVESARKREHRTRSELVREALRTYFAVGASIPVAVCILNRNKRPERRRKVLFVDAAQEGYFRAGKAQNFLDPEHIEKIVAAVQAFGDAPRLAHVAFFLQHPQLRPHRRVTGPIRQRGMDLRTAGAPALIEDIHDLPLAAAQSGMCGFRCHAKIFCAALAAYC